MPGQPSDQDAIARAFQVQAIEAWQADSSLHPLTCRTNSGYRILVPADDGVKVVLRCPDCGYEQTFPSVVTEAYAKRLRERLQPE